MEYAIKLLGTFSVCGTSGGELTLSTRKARALLAYLAAHAGEPQPRERLMTLLWSERSSKQARQSLNSALMSIRKLGDGYLASAVESDREQVKLRLGVAEIDVLQFQRHLGSDPDEALTHVGGPFLDGLSVPEPAFEDWMTSMRAKVETDVCDALARSAERSAAAGDPEAAVATLKRLLDIDPLVEPAHRRAITLMLEMGDRAGAKRQFEACVAILERELGVKPDAATLAVMAQTRGSVRGTGANSPGVVCDAQLDLPSVAVLPFTNMSGNPEDEFFADGVTEDIITALARFRSLFVISRTSTFAYKDTSMDARAIAEELGVRYTLEGSVRWSGEHCRITGQLIDADTGRHLWAERFDSVGRDLFAVQDKIANAIVGIIGPEIGHAERERARRAPPDSLDAWTLYQRGLSAMNTAANDTIIQRTIELFDQVNDNDPNFAPAFAMAALARIRLRTRFEYASDADRDYRARLIVEIGEKARRGAVLDPFDSLCMWADGVAHSMFGNHDVAIRKVREAMRINPNDVGAHMHLAYVLHRAGYSEEVLAHLDRSLQLSPHDAFVPRVLTYRSLVLLNAGRFEESLAYARQASLHPNTSTGAFPIVAAALVNLRRLEEARTVIGEFLELAPGLTTGILRNKFWIGSPGSLEPFLAALARAGLPE